MYVFCQVCDDCGCMLCDGEYKRLEEQSILEEIEEEFKQEEKI